MIHVGGLGAWTYSACTCTHGRQSGNRPGRHPSPWEYRLSTQPNVYGDVLLDTGSSCCLSMAVGVRALLFPGGLVVLVAPTGGVPHRTVDFIDCWVLALPIMPDCNNFLQNFSLISHKHASASCPSLLLSFSRTYVVPYQYFLPAMHARNEGQTSPET